MRKISVKPSIVGVVLGWAWWRCLMEAALADPYSELGVSKEAFSGTNGWKAASCEFADAGSDLDVECAIMEVAKNQTIVDGKNKESQRLRPVSLKCPESKKNGVIDYNTKNDIGIRGRVRITYKNGGAFYIDAEAFEPNATVPTAGFRGRTEEFAEEFVKADDVRLANRYINLMAALKNKVCFGSAEAKNRYFDWINANRVRLNMPANPAPAP